ncbi:GreA/GreB family elongation factor [Streptomyces sp. NPDC048441]|uniref:GreA/GreB family elongation factor n=1 Tax=Streptomyces sp. NPDC048441 TaxID=3365552 RepID=UPI0037171111
MTGQPEPISATARRALEEELNGLREERAKVASTLRDVDYQGDRGDQADELERSNDLGHLDARISEITLRLRQADGAGPPASDVVGVGSTVTVRFSDGTTQTIQIGEVAEYLDRAEVTEDSPLGRALLGRGVGDSVTYETPDGQAGVTVVSLGEG